MQFNKRFLLFFFCLGLPSTAASLAQDNRPTNTPNIILPPATRTEITTQKLPLIAAPLTLGQFQGMKPDTSLAGKLLVLNDFVQQTPVNGASPTQQTTLYAGRTSSALYFVFVCFDTDPSAIRAHLSRRENILTDDYVGLLLDPLGDHRRGVFFATNAFAVQADGSWDDNNSSGLDLSYDQVWDSTGRLTSQGWMAEIVIPFHSLRFRTGEPGSNWGVVFRRFIPRQSERDTWPLISDTINRTLAQEGTLSGIDCQERSHNLQLNPYALGQNEHTLNSLDPNNPYFSSRKVEATAGGELKAIVHESVVIDATVNPDFSQVESDQPQFTVNQRYPVYFPELRPFFLENANYFNTPIDLVYTRNIVRPEYGARVTGKLENTNFGALVIDDRGPGETYSPGAPNYAKKAVFGIGRLSQDLSKGSSVGLIFTDYEFQGSFNRVGGVDFLAQLNDKWTLAGQSVESSTRNQDASYAAGPATKFDLNRAGHSFSFDNTYRDYASGFNTNVGFISSADIRREDLSASYEWYPKHSRLQSITFETQNSAGWDHAGDRVLRYSQEDFVFNATRGFSFSPLVLFNSDTVGPQDGYALEHNVDYAENGAGFVIRGAPTSALNYNVSYTQDGNVNYNPLPNAVPQRLTQNNVQALLTFQPISSFTIDNTYLLDRDHLSDSGADVYESQTLRTKLNYQFTRALSARVIVEYDSVLVNPAMTSLQRTKQVATQALFTWLPHPGTAIYIGYNNDIQNLDRTLCSRANGGGCNAQLPILGRSSNYLQDGRQFFMKFSYLYRF